MTPTFIFGLNDSYKSLFPSIDRKMYKAVPFCFPWFIPNWSKASAPLHMIVGPPIDTCAFDTDEELALEYFDCLETLFESNKRLHPGYENRLLDFVAVPKKTVIDHSRVDVTPHVLATGAKSFFIVVFLVYKVVFGQWHKFSNFGNYEPIATMRALLWHPLMWHAMSSLLWAVFSGFLTIQGFDGWFRKYHRGVGKVAVLFNALMSGSGIMVVLNGLATKTLAVGEIETYHVLWHAFCNVQISCLVTYQLWHAILYARKKRKVEHQRLMAIIHLTIFSNFLPRVTSRLTYCCIPVSGDMAFSIACLVQWMYHLSQVMKSNKNADVMKALMFAAKSDVALLGMSVFGVKVLGIQGQGLHLGLTTGMLLFLAGVGWKNAERTVRKLVEKEKTENARVAEEAKLKTDKTAAENAIVGARRVSVSAPCPPQTTIALAGTLGENGAEEKKDDAERLAVGNGKLHVE